MIELPLEGRTALVTGAARRTGRALALALARAGADVAVHFHTSEREAAEVVAEIRGLGRASVPVRADLTDAADAARAVDLAAKDLGRLDVLVNNVGVIVWKRIDEIEVDEWRASLAGTLDATWHTCRAALPHMRGQGYGRIVNVLDADADRLRATPLATPYKIGKTGSLVLTQTLAQTEAPHGITVNAVSPGTLENSQVKPPLERIPAGRYGTTDDLAAAVLFLASEAAAYVTGTNVKVSGGYLI